jgi:hypothetical protein
MAFPGARTCSETGYGTHFCAATFRDGASLFPADRGIAYVTTHHNAPDPFVRTVV